MSNQQQDNEFCDGCGFPVRKNSETRQRNDVRDSLLDVRLANALRDAKVLANALTQVIKAAYDEGDSETRGGVPLTGAELVERRLAALIEERAKEGR